MINYDKLNLFYLFWGLRFWGKHVYFVDQSSEMFGRFLIFLYNWNCLGTVPFFRMTFQGQSFAEAWIFAFFWSKKLSGSACSSYPGCSSHYRVYAMIFPCFPMAGYKYPILFHSFSHYIHIRTAMSRDVDGFHWSILWELWMVAKSPVDTLW